MTEGSKNPSVSFADSIPQFSMVVPLRSQARLWYFLLHWGLRTGLRFAGPVFRGCGRPLGVSSPLHPFGASTGLLRPVSATGGGLRAPLSRLRRQHSSIQHGRPTPSHRPALTLARCSAPADFASLRVLGAPAASRPPTLASSLAALPASLGSSYRPALRWPGIPGLRSASRCPRPFTPSGLRRQRPVSRTARGLRAPRRRRPSVPALRTALAFGGAVFRRCGRPLGVCSRLQPLRGLQRPAVGTGMHFYVSHRPSIQHGRSTALASSLVALPASLGLLRPVSATGGGLRAPLRFACAVFRACALRVLATSALRAFTFLQAFAPEKYQK